MKIDYLSAIVLILHQNLCLFAKYTTSITDTHTQLIYEFTTYLKHIHRISFMSCSQSRPLNFDSYQAHSQTTSPRTASPNTIIDSLALVENLFKAKGILIKVLAIDTVSTTTFWSATSGQMKLWKSLFRSEDHRQVVVLNLSCGNNSLEILQLASNEGLFNSSYHWLLIDENSKDRDEFVDDSKLVCEDYRINRSSKVWSRSKQTEAYEYVENSIRWQLIEFLAKLNINVNTELLVAVRNGRKENDCDYLLYDVWSPGRLYGAELNVTEVGKFYHNNGLQMYDWFRKTSNIVRRMNMKNALIRCMIVITSRMTENFEDYLNHHRNPHLDSMNRFNFALLSHVRDMFDFRFHLSRTNSWGYLKNGTYDGMIGALIRRQVDIGGSPIFFRRKRAEVIDYTAKTWIARPCFIFRHSSDLKLLQRNIFLGPFSNRVWMCIGVWGLVTILLLWNLRRTEENLLNETSWFHTTRLSSNNFNKDTQLQHLGIHAAHNNRHHIFPKSTNTSASRAARIHRCNRNPKDFLASILDCRHKSRCTIPLRRFLERFFGSEQQSSELIPSNANPLTATSVPGNANSFQAKTHYRNFTNNGNSHKNDFRLFRSLHSPPLPPTPPTTLDSNPERSSEYRGAVPLKDIQWIRNEFFARNHAKNGNSSTTGNNDSKYRMRTITNLVGCLPATNNGNDGESHLSSGNFNKKSNPSKRMKKRMSSARTCGSSLSCMLFFIGAMCQQGPHYSCHLLSGRIVILSTLLFAFCISQFYSGTIVGTLLMEKPKTIKTIRDLINSSLNIVIENIVYNRDYFQRTTDPDAIELYRRKISQPVDSWGEPGSGRDGRHSIYSNVEAESDKRPVDSMAVSEYALERHRTKSDARKMKRGVAGAVKQSWISPEEGLKLMKTGGYAFHVDVATAYKIISETFTEQEICELTEIQLFPPQKMVAIVQKGSPLRRTIAYGLQRLAETGLMDRQRKVWHSQKPRCVRQIQPTDLRVGMETFESALFVLIFGLAASGVILALEVMYDLWHKRSIASKSPNIAREWSNGTVENQHKRQRFYPAVAATAASFKDNAGEDFEFVN